MRYGKLFTAWPSTIRGSWRLFSFSPENCIAQSYKGAYEYTHLNQIRICNIPKHRPPFFRLEG